MFTRSWANYQLGIAEVAAGRVLDVHASPVAVACAPDYSTVRADVSRLNTKRKTGIVPSTGYSKVPKIRSCVVKVHQR
jgi:hypothetical protein